MGLLNYEIAPQDTFALNLIRLILKQYRSNTVWHVKLLHHNVLKEVENKHANISNRTTNFLLDVNS